MAIASAAWARASVRKFGFGSRFYLCPELGGKIKQAPDDLRVIELGNRSLVLGG